MPGKRSYVNAVSGCMTQDQLRRQARDRAFLPQPPPPPLSEVPRYSAWADIVDKCDCATQCQPAFTDVRPSFPAAQAEPPLSGNYLDTINRALGIIEIQSRLLAAPLPPRTISLDGPLPSSECALETLLVDPVSLPLNDAPFTLSETICMPPAPLLVDAPLALEEVIYYHVYLPATGCYYIGEEEDNDYSGENFAGENFAALEERVTKIDTDQDLVILGSIQIEKHISAFENSATPVCGPVPGTGSGAAASDSDGPATGGAYKMSKLVGWQEEGARDEPEPLTAAQHSEINRIFTNSFAGFIDQIIGKV